MIFLRFVGSIVIFATALRMPSLSQYEAQWGWLATAIWSVSAANDVVIAATLVVLLHAKRTDEHKRQVMISECFARRAPAHAWAEPVQF